MAGCLFGLFSRLELVDVSQKETVLTIDRAIK